MMSNDSQSPPRHLVDAQGRRHELGAMPAGTYKVMARFLANDVPFEAGEPVMLQPGERVTLECDAPFLECRR